MASQLAQCALHRPAARILCIVQTGSWETHCTDRLPLDRLVIALCLLSKHHLDCQSASLPVAQHNRQMSRAAHTSVQPESAPRLCTICVVVLLHQDVHALADNGNGDLAERCRLDASGCHRPRQLHFMWAHRVHTLVQGCTSYEWHWRCGWALVALPGAALAA